MSSLDLSKNDNLIVNPSNIFAIHEKITLDSRDQNISRND